MSGLWQDLRSGLRAMRRSAGFTATAVLTLALGIGASTAVFSVLNAVLLRPLSFPSADRLVQVVERSPKIAARIGTGPDDFPISLHNYRDYRDGNRSFEEMGWFLPPGELGAANLAGGERPRRIQVQSMSASAFSVLGVRPMLGRIWNAEEDIFLPQAQRVALIGDRLWQQAFGGDPRIVGRLITLEGWPHEVIGVMPPGFDLPPLLSAGTVEARRIDAYVPLAYNALDQSRRARHALVVARLRQGVTPQQAQSDLSGQLAAIAEQNESIFDGVSVQVSTLQDLAGDVFGPRLGLLMAAVAMVFLIACVNVANLLLARGIHRRGEMAVRAALGGGRLRLIRLLTVESLLLAVAATFVGLALSIAGIRALVAASPVEIPRVAESGIDLTVAGFALGLTLVTLLAIGVLPALRTTRIDLVKEIKDGQNSGTSARGRGRSMMIAVEVAVALLLLIGAGLLARSFLRLSQVEQGYDPRNLLVVDLDVGWPNYYNRYWDCGDFRELMWRTCQLSDERRTFFDRVVVEVEALPGVVSAALIDVAPLVPGNKGIYPLRVETEASREAEPGSEKHEMGEARGQTDGRQVTPGYFETMRIGLLAGRDFRDGDPGGWEGVAVVNRALAEEMWPGEGPLGKKVTFYGGGKWMTVIGVVEDTEDSNLADEGLYADGSRDRHVYHLGGFNSMNLVVHTETDPAQLIEPLRDVVQRIDGDMPIGDITTMEELSAASLAIPRYFLSVLGFFAIAAMGLAILGLYSVVAFAVGERTREIGLRMALGARAAQIRHMIVREALVPVLIGLLLGLAAGSALTRVLESLLYGLSPLDPIVFVSLPALLFAVALMASYLPARRASRLDPMKALRYE